MNVTLGVDVGGSGLRFRISEVGRAPRAADLGHAPAGSVDDTKKVLKDLHAGITKAIGDFKCVGAAVGVAGPIVHDRVVVTNWAGPPASRTLDVATLPDALFPRSKTRLLNDLEAGSYGIVAADQQAALPKCFTQLFKGRSQGGSVLGQRTAVIGLGSGLGIALIIGHGAKATVVPTECGHLQIPMVLPAHPRHRDEIALLSKVSALVYGDGGRLMPEFEDVASGRGIGHLYEAICGEKLDGGEVAKRGKAGEGPARKALALCHTYLVRAAKAVATGLNCDSVTLALDNQARDYQFVKSIERDLEDEFYDFIRPDWVQKIRVFTQTEPMNFNLLGAAYVAGRVAAGTL